ncbi:MAG: RNA polymerase subunit sigma-24, partial [Marmoricola sp.]
ALLGLLAPDVVLVTDGGGIRKAALRPIVGAEKVLRFLTAVRPVDTEAVPMLVNGEPCLVIFTQGELDGIFAIRMVGGVITEIYGVRNPEKLSRLSSAVSLSRT